MRLFRTGRGIILEDGRRACLLADQEWHELLNRADLAAFLGSASRELTSLLTGFNPDTEESILPPLDLQEVWAAGVTYYRSRDARVEESKGAGGADCYTRVYQADRPELFFKSTPHRTSGHRAPVRIRRDSKWNVPEPELALFVNGDGRIAGYTIGNDMSSRDIEGENPLYLPQAKVYDGSCALGPGLLVALEPLRLATGIRMEVLRGEATVFAGATTLAQLKRTPESLVEYLFRDNSFPHGCFLLTGTGIVPPADFTLRAGDEIRITIDAIGTLSNTVA